MKSKKLVVIIEQFANLFELLSIILVLMLSLLFQFVLGELPCPLCLLQRVGFIFIAFGFLLNLRFGFRPSHYSIVLISALFTSFVALRQIYLHVLPNTGSYGNAVLGLHLYTWSFIIAMSIAVTTALLLGCDRQYRLSQYKNVIWRHWINIVFGLIMFILAANIISVFFECGFYACPDNPTVYEVVVP
jgi:disulfide bond formation protein DsbB